MMRFKANGVCAKIQGSVSVSGDPGIRLTRILKTAVYKLATKIVIKLMGERAVVNQRGPSRESTSHSFRQPSSGQFTLAKDLIDGKRLQTQRKTVGTKANHGSSDADETLILNYRAGNTSAFNQLYDRHKGALFRYFFRQCGNRSTCEELFQETWLTLIKNLGHYTVEAKFTTYLYRLAHSRLVDHYRRNSRADLEPSDYEEFACEESQQPEQVIELAERQASFLEALETLPAEQREVFLLRVETALSLIEIANVLDIPVERTKSRLRYAVKKLSRHLFEHSSDDTEFRTGTLG